MGDPIVPGYVEQDLRFPVAESHSLNVAPIGHGDEQPVAIGVGRGSLPDIFISAPK